MITFKDNFAEDANAEISRRNFRFGREYEDENYHYQFTINHVEPVRYATCPIIVDQTVFVEVSIINKANGERKITKNVSLGKIFGDRGERDFVPFGEKYFEETKEDMRKIVCKIKNGSS